MKRILAMLMGILLLGTPVFAAHDHEHHAPHGGALVVLGEESAHLEFVLDKGTGKLTAYVLDAHADGAILLRIAQLSLKITLEDKISFDVSLTPVANPLTGETIDNTSEFTAVVEELKGIERFEGVVDQLTIKGAVFSKVAFSYPEGNEHDEGHTQEHHQH